jgi:hypothetical protein
LSRTKNYENWFPWGKIFRMKLETIYVRARMLKIINLKIFSHIIRLRITGLKFFVDNRSSSIEFFGFFRNFAMVFLILNKKTDSHFGSLLFSCACFFVCFCYIRKVSLWDKAFYPLFLLKTNYFATHKNQLQTGIVKS